MKKSIGLTICIVLGMAFNVNAQNELVSSAKSFSAIGLGLGLPYGGIGLNFTTYAADNFGLFGGIGYQFAGVGYNFGMIKDFLSSGQAQLYLTAMYGSNASIVVEGASEFNKVYTGFTTGMGVKINSRRTEGNYWNFGLLLPFRSSDFRDDFDMIDENPNIIIEKPWPVLIVVGYHLKL